MGKAVVDTIGPLLVDLAHSIHHVKLPGDGDPMAVKRGLFEPMLKLAGISYFSEQGVYVPCRSEEGECACGPHLSCTLYIHVHDVHVSAYMYMYTCMFTYTTYVVFRVE